MCKKISQVMLTSFLLVAEYNACFEKHQVEKIGFNFSNCRKAFTQAFSYIHFSYLLKSKEARSNERASLYVSLIIHVDFTTSRNKNRDLKNYVECYHRDS